MADDKDKPTEEAVFTKSAAQLDAERRVEEAEKADDDDSATVGVVDHFVTVNPSYGVEEDGGYIGVSPEYRNAADDRQKPFNPEDGWTEALAVEPAEDAGEKVGPSVPGVRVGAPAVEAGEGVVLTSTSAEAPAAKAAAGTTKANTPSPAPSKASGSK